MIKYLRLCGVLCALVSLTYVPVVLAEPAALRVAVEHLDSGDPSEAARVLDELPEKEKTATVAYVLAVAYSRLGDPEATWRYALDALDGTPPLSTYFMSDAKLLIRWAAVEVQRHSVQISIGLSSIISESPEEEATRKRLELLRIRTNFYLNIFPEIESVLITNSCWGDHGYVCIQGWLSEIEGAPFGRSAYSPPEVELPERLD